MREKLTSKEDLPLTSEQSVKPSQSARKQSILIYLIVLFTVAFLLLLMAYFIQKRASETDFRDTERMALAETQLDKSQMIENYREISKQMDCFM